MRTMSNSNNKLGVEHVDPALGDLLPPTSNPFVGSANVLISVPESIEIKLVEAGVLVDYEVLLLLLQVCFSAMVGFIVAYCQATEVSKRVLLVAIFVLGLLTVGLFIAVCFKRSKLYQKTKRVPYRLGEEVKVNDKISNK